MRIDVNSIQSANQYKITSQNVAAIQNSYVQQNDKIEISDDGKLFSDMLRSAKDSIAERLSNTPSDLSALRNKIENDEYHVDSGTLAKKILMDV